MTRGPGLLNECSKISINYGKIRARSFIAANHIATGEEMPCIETQAMSDEYYEEEVIEEEYVDEVDDESLGDEDWLASIKSSLQAEARQRQAGTEKTAGGERVTVNTGGAVSIGSEEKVPVEAEPKRVSGVEYEEIEEHSESFSEQEVDAEVTEGLDDEDFMESIQSSMQKLFRERKAELAAVAAAAASPKVEAVASQSVEVEDDGSEYEFEEQVIERWFEREPAEPADMEAACRALIPIVYKGENMNAETTRTMLRRTPLPELYKYLKQHYDYKKEVKQDLTAEETSGEAQMTLANLFEKRSAGSSLSAGSEASALHGDENEERGRGATTGDLDEGRESQRPSIQAQSLVNSETELVPSMEDSQVLYEEVMVDSTTDLSASCILMGESGRSFEEFIEETEHEEVEIEETIGEDDEEEFLEETLHEDDEEGGEHEYERVDF